MNRVLNEREIEVIHMLRAKKPKTRGDLEAAGLTLKSLGNGLYREAFEIEGTELVVKINGNHYDSPDHSKREIKVWKKVLRSPALSSIVPPLRYHGEEDMIVTDKIELQINTDPDTQQKLYAWRDELKFPRDIRPVDMHPSNIGVYNNRFVVSDLGCFYE